MTMMLKVKNLKKRYVLEKTFLGKEKTLIDAVDGVSFSIKKGESFALVGESGCGKSTTARCILNLIESDGGSVQFEDNVLFDYDKNQTIHKKEMLRLRKDLQIIFQDPMASLDNRMKVIRIVAEGIEKHQLAKGQEAIDMAQHYLDICGIDKNMTNRYPHEFSGGQRQRIGIARALAVKPKFIIADEPVAALDVSIQAQIINLLNDLKEQYMLTFLFISHDLSVVKYFADRIAVMYKGNIVEIASSDELFKNPMHPYTKTLLSSIPVSHPKLRKDNMNLEISLNTSTHTISGCKFYNYCKKSNKQCTKEQPVLKEIYSGHFVACCV